MAADNLWDPTFNNPDDIDWFLQKVDDACSGSRKVCVRLLRNDGTDSWPCDFNPCKDNKFWAYTWTAPLTEATQKSVKPTLDKIAGRCGLSSEPDSPEYECGYALTDAN